MTAKPARGEFGRPLQPRDDPSEKTDGDVVPDQSDDRPPMAVAMQWVSQITTVALEMVLPAVLGLWVDGKWNTEPWFLICGAVGGFALGMWHLLQMAKTSEKPPETRDRSSKP